MAYVAGKRLKIGEGWRQKGELVPEAEAWNHIESWLASGEIVFIPDNLADHFLGTNTAVSKVPFHGDPAADAGLEAIYQSRRKPVRLSDVVEAEDESETVADNEGDNASESDSELPEYIEDPADYNAKVVVDYAKEHPEHAEMLYDAECEGKDRSTVKAGLKSLVESAQE